jgi:microcin C transport system substrate-binding protein
VKLSRRTLLRSGAALLAPPAAVSGLAQVARANEPEWRHGLSLFGELKYPAGFKRFDYVNPNAPKGGSARLGGFGTFDNFNIVVAGVKGTIAAGLNEIYDTLMVRPRTKSRPSTDCSPKPSVIRRISPPSPTGCVRTRNGMTASR